MRAHIMAWLLYTTPAQLRRQLGAFGLDIAEQPDLLELLQSELAGSFPVLRCLARLDAGECRAALQPGMWVQHRVVEGFS